MSLLVRSVTVRDFVAFMSSIDSKGGDGFTDALGTVMGFGDDEVWRPRRIQWCPGNL